MINNVNSFKRPENTKLCYLLLIISPFTNVCEISIPKVTHIYSSFRFGNVSGLLLLYFFNEYTFDGIAKLRDIIMQLETFIFCFKIATPLFFTIFFRGFERKYLLSLVVVTFVLIIEVKFDRACTITIFPINLQFRNTSNHELLWLQKVHKSPVNGVIIKF